MKKQLFLVVSIMLALGFSSCSKKMGELPQDLFKVTPNPLEVKGGKIDAKVDGKFPEKYFNKNAEIAVTPVLKYNGTETRGTTKVFQGESVTGNNQVISNKEGGNFSVASTFNYVPEMAKSELYLDFAVKVKGKEAPAIPQVKVADGAIATAELASASAGEIAPAITPDKFQRIIKETQEADIKFLIQQTTLRNSETKSQEIKDLTTAVKDAKNTENKEVSSLNIIGYASPDGPLALNRNLAERRLDVTASYLNSELKKMKANVAIGKDFTPEDWEGFKKLMEESNIQDKQLILRVLSMYSDPEQREREIKNISSAYTVIADEILPQLRRSRMQLTVDVIGKSDEEITQLAKNNPSSLSADELLYAATLTNDLTEKAVIYQRVINNYSNDARGYNNLGMVRYYQGNIDEALSNFTKAARIASDDASINYNLGLVALEKGELDKAEQYFGKSAGANADLNQALGTLYVAKGDYSKAKTTFGSTASNNAALMQILNGDYNAARRTLSAVSNPDATTSYLGAVIGARTNDRNTVYNNLRAAIAKDKSFAAKAISDIEFAKFMADETFMSIVK
ncbi:tetratricopeptide repeat protein [Paludibacter sp. 221]|uniref:tetratricopeptide repeat protein n=1 Tax=Paludibacter sp. 221 TaxID=2302939 RepID=UPI0013D27615|nr:tetratricopeptide repeat protein [Paludibacter sp. 221]NDV46740.1 tetratricopeptide repeat protein [Paludibacter sp. 221]